MNNTPIRVRLEISVKLANGTRHRLASRLNDYWTLIRSSVYLSSSNMASSTISSFIECILCSLKVDHLRVLVSSAMLKVRVVSEYYFIVALATDALTIILYKYVASYPFL